MTGTKDTDDETNEWWKAVSQFIRQADEAQALYLRGNQLLAERRPPGFRQHMAALAKRSKSGDKNVVAYLDENGVVTHYKEQISDEEKTRMILLYQKERTIWGDFCISDDDRHEQAKCFVETIAEHGCDLPFLEALMPPIQKERQRNIDSVANAFDKLVDSLGNLDSAALGWLFATIEDKAAESGISIRPPGPDVPTLKDSAFRAQVEAGEARLVIKKLSDAIGSAIRDAGKTLPKVAREENDPRLHAAFFLERQMEIHNLSFQMTETSFSAECLRTMFELGGYETDRVSYWLKKVSETPDNEVPWFGAPRKFKG